MQIRRISMLRANRLVSFFILLCCVALSSAQGGAAGYGQGGGAGGGFGGGGFRGGDGLGGPGSKGDINRPQFDKAARPDEDETAGLWESKSAILTPGDRVEFKIKAHKGETLLAGATSDAFDPALSVEDSKGTVLTKNDDRAEGDQAPFVICRFPDEGTYTLKVLSFRSVSGGKFTVKMRTITATDAPLAKSDHPPVGSSSNEGFADVVFRISAKKDKFYDLRQVRGFSPNSEYLCSLRRVVGPTGVEANDFEMIPTADTNPVFRALADGDFYFEYRTSSGAQRYVTDYREVKVVSATPTSELAIDLDPGELKIVELPVTPNLIVRTTYSSPGLAFNLSAPAAESPVEDNSGDESYGNNAFWLWFRMNLDSNGDVVRVFHGTGTARFVLRSMTGEPQKVAFKNAVSLPTWEVGETAKSTLEIGDSRLFLIKSSKSELMRVFASAGHFQPRLDIFRLNGTRANTLSNRKTHTAGDDLYFPEADTFIVRLSCEGHGGSGEFAMKRTALTPTPYVLGSAQVLKLDGANFGLYSVNLEAGKRYQLMTDQPRSFLRADLLDDDGQFLVSQRVMFDKVEVQWFIPTRSGRHRLWLRGAPGERHFKFELHVPPTIGG